jgi:hypothetical protein
MTCPFCGGAAHPATGCEYTPTFVACRRCTVEFWAWVRRWTKPRKGSDFYGAAAKRNNQSQSELAKA